MEAVITAIVLILAFAILGILAAVSMLRGMR
jgi:hypothetical protein